MIYLHRKYPENTGQEGNAYLTVCAALCIAVILSLCLTLIEGAARNGVRLEAECVTDIGLNSIMAEYHRELMKQYNLFAVDASYGTGVCGKTNTESHLRHYVEKNLDYKDVFLSNYLYGDFLAIRLDQCELTRVNILTDRGGAVFRRYAAEAMRSDTGLELLEQLQEWMRTVEVNGLEEGGQEAEKDRLDREIEEYDGMEVEVEKDQWEALEVVNPTGALEQKKKLGILKLVTEDETGLSCNVLDIDSLVGNRIKNGQVNQGSILQQELSGPEKLAERFLFQEYLLKYMGRYGKENQENTLRYQVEYLIAGKDSDVENLKSVVNRICIIREAANVMHLLADEVKHNEARAAAALVCTLVFLPELTALLETAIILGWAYAESIYDVKSLLSGGKVPLLKDAGSWHYDLTSALYGDLTDGTEEGKGLSYEDHLRILLMFTDEDIITARAMDMVEADIRSTPGNAAFRLDGCYTELEARLQFSGFRGYSCEITRRKKYR